MTLSLEEISDRLEIHDLIVEYADIIDSKQFDRLNEVFHEDAYIDYTAMGGIEGKLSEIKAFLSEVMPMFPATQHMISNFKITLDGDRAHGRIMCLNPQQIVLHDESVQTMFLGLWYVDEYVRTEQGWRILTRREEKSYDYNVPEFMKGGVGG